MAASRWQMLAAPPYGRCCGTYEADRKLKHSKRKKAEGDAVKDSILLYIWDVLRHVTFLTRHALSFVKLERACATERRLCARPAPYAW
jgi:hypothetical protein